MDVYIPPLLTFYGKTFWFFVLFWFFVFWGVLLFFTYCASFFFHSNLSWRLFYISMWGSHPFIIFRVFYGFPFHNLFYCFARSESIAILNGGAVHFRTDFIYT